MKKFWICYVEGTTGGRHYKHFELPLAKAEAERLASLPENQDKNVYLLKCVGQCRMCPSVLKWEIDRITELPYK